MVKESNIDEAKGRLKQAAGDLTNDKEMEREGKVDRMVAGAKGKAEDAKEKASDLIDKARDAVSSDKH